MNNQLTSNVHFNILFCMILGLTACADSIVDTSLDNQSTDKIVNGANELNEASTVALVRNNRVTCTGTVIAPRAILTAAHCIYNKSKGYNVPEGVGVVVNNQVLEVARVIDYVIHAQYTGEPRDRAQGRDIAILYLEKNLSVEPAILDRDSVYTRVNQIGKIVGYGRTDVSDYDSGGTKNSVHLKVDKIHGPHQNIFELTSYDNEARSACNGDSGGALFFGQGNQRVLSGVASHVHKSCERYSRYIAVSPYTQWIDENMYQPTTGVRRLGGPSVNPPVNQGNTTPNTTNNNTNGTHSGGPTCHDLILCLNTCSSGQCQDACFLAANSLARINFESVSACSDDWGCGQELSCLRTSCQSELFACSPALVSSSSNNESQRSDQPINTSYSEDQEEVNHAYDCNQMLRCMLDCTTDQCYDDCYYQGDSDAQVEYGDLALCASEMSCGDSRCVEDYCAYELDACRY